MDSATPRATRFGWSDDALVHGQRLCEWTSRAPFLEEDLALANTALDYLGRARLLYQRASEGVDADEDDFAYRRDTREFTNLLLFELPRGDFAFTIVRQFLVDVFEVPFLAGLSASSDPGLAAIAAKGVKEAEYHLRRSRDWLRRLGDGTQESHDRAQRALDELWGYLPELFDMDLLEHKLAAGTASVAVPRQELESEFRTTVAAAISEATLTEPDASWVVRGGRTGNHTEHLGYLLAEMQFMQRAYPDRQW